MTRAVALPPESAVQLPLPVPSTTMSKFRLFQEDAVEFLRTLGDESVHLIVTDPPYESLEKHRAVGTTTRLKHSKASSNDWFGVFPNRRFPELFSELYRVLATDSHFYLFSDQQTMFVAKPLIERTGFVFHKPIVWDKVNLGLGYHYRARYELVLFCEKGRRKLNDLSVPDILRHPRIVRGYPTEKPVALGELFVRQSSQPGETVLDPFMGSAAFGVAAVALGRTFWGNDISPRALALAHSRLERISAGSIHALRQARST